MYQFCTPKIIVKLMESKNNASLIMANRLKQLRNERNLSHEKLSKALSKLYGVKISPDSLMNYEVADLYHSKAGKNQGMRVEFLRCLADFYGVSTDYLLGADVPKSPDVTIQKIIEYTGLSEKTVMTLRAWNNVLTLLEGDENTGISDAEKAVVKTAKRMTRPDETRRIYIDLINKLVSSVSTSSSAIGHYGSFINNVYSNKQFREENPNVIYELKDTVSHDLAAHGFVVMDLYESSEWHLSKLCKGIERELRRRSHQEIYK